jgi:crotonobetainyl-CoA:carnitine CoA-transferase CaiB-like acyl-CoA transferase
MPALEGIRVVDLTEALAGPYCTMILGDLGADVIKIERPGAGDQSRRWGPPFVGTESAYYLSINRNKRSVVVDLKSGEGRATMQRLLERADVFVCNVRRLESLREAGLDPDAVCARHPRLVYCSITAYGRTGPYAGRGGYDVVAQGEAGLMAATGDPDGEPVRWPVASADLSTGLWAATSILSALLARERTGRGQYLDQSLLEGQLSWAPVMAAQLFASGERPARLGNRHANIVPYEVFRARDKRLVVAVGTEEHWRRFCEAVGLGGAVRDDPRFATNGDRLRNRAALAELLNAAFGRDDAARWLARLRAADVPCGPVNQLDETLGDPQVLHRGMVVDFDHPMGAVRLLATPVHLSETPVTYRRRPPLLGEHTEEVLRQLGGNLRSVALGRPPRYDARLAVRVVHRGRTVRGTTLDISEGGCAVKVGGLRPEVGDDVSLLVSAGSRRVPARAVVRWSAPCGGTRRVIGVRVHVEGQDGAWRDLVAAVIRSGARAPAAGDADPARRRRADRSGR